jgi:hypothetical protein
MIKTLPKVSATKLYQMGIQIKGKLLLVVDDGHLAIPAGSLVTLTLDDDSSNPAFSIVQGKHRKTEYHFEYPLYINMDRLAVYDETDPQHAAFRARIKLGGLTE